MPDQRNPACALVALAGLTQKLWSNPQHLLAMRTTELQHELAQGVAPLRRIG
jgi:hypothetical protein